MKNNLWVEKYRPSTLDDYIFQDTTQEKILRQMVVSGNIPHLLFSGAPGTGKTTLARILLNELGVEDADILVINASDENSVETMREKIKSFITTYAFGPYKVVVMEEGDYISKSGQGVLRSYMEDMADNVRFIITCNYDSRLMPAIKSRTQQFHFSSFDRNQVAEYVANILIVEHVKFSVPILDYYVDMGYPDIRKIINLVQQYTVVTNNSRRLQRVDGVAATGDYVLKITQLISADKWSELRIMLSSEVLPDEWSEVYRILYDNLDKSPKFSDEKKWEDGIVTIAEYLYKHSIVADPNINASAMLISLKMI